MRYLLLFDFGCFLFLWVVDDVVYFEYLQDELHLLGHLLGRLVVEVLDDGLSEVLGQ